MLEGGVKSKWEAGTSVSAPAASRKRFNDEATDRSITFDTGLPENHKSWESVEDILETKTDDYLIQLREKAATLIQRWYRRCRIRSTAGAAAMKRMMAQKKEDMETRMNAERHQVKEMASFMIKLVSN